MAWAAACFVPSARRFAPAVAIPPALMAFFFMTSSFSLDSSDRTYSPT